MAKNLTNIFGVRRGAFVWASEPDEQIGFVFEDTPRFARGALLVAKVPLWCTYIPNFAGLSFHVELLVLESKPEAFPRSRTCRRQHSCRCTTGVA